jgi:hypothetical protein
VSNESPSPSPAEADALDGRLCLAARQAVLVAFRRDAQGVGELVNRDAHGPNRKTPLGV